MSSSILLIVGSLTVAFVAVVASAHAVLYKRDVRAAVGWVGVIWLVPLVGAALYALLGVNRIKRQAEALLSGAPHVDVDAALEPVESRELTKRFGEANAHLDDLARLVERVTGQPLVAGNEVVPLPSGDDAFARMLEAIDGAKRSIALLTYIFDKDAIGDRFIAALRRAKERGVEVRVLIDAAGARYSRPSIVPELRRSGLITAQFLPFRLFRARFFNLRNHRKLLLVDGERAFTGGMNIRVGHALSESPAHPVQDIHFEMRGPIVAQLRGVFAQDWAFSHGEALTGPAWEAVLDPRGEVLARSIVDGPDEDLDKCRWTILGALGCARKHVQITTPYFLPDQALITALNVAAMRGVTVDILIPARSNLAFVDWACWSQLWQLLRRRCRIWLTPGPFDHSKLMLVDGVWLMCGSANWDPRSLRLNFELNVECYDRALAQQLSELVEEKRAQSRRLLLEEVEALPTAVRLRNGLARLFMPYM